MSKDTDQKSRRAETVVLQGNVKYAKVSTRLVEFHEDNPECSIETDVQFQTGENMWIVVTATVTCPRGKFVAHSMDVFKGKQKFLEKLETVAVGRALAYAGYMASGEIASFEEMDTYESSKQREATSDFFADQLKAEINRASTMADIEALCSRTMRMTLLDGESLDEVQQAIARRREELLKP